MQQIEFSVDVELDTASLGQVHFQLGYRMSVESRVIILMHCLFCHCLLSHIVACMTQSR